MLTKLLKPQIDPVALLPDPVFAPAASMGVEVIVRFSNPRFEDGK
jgi:hypothetical protein